MRRSSSLPLAVLLLLPLGCGPGPEPSHTPERQTTAFGNVEIEHFTDARNSSQRVEARRAAVWPALLRTYEEMEIPVTSVDQARGVLGNARLARTRTLNRQRLSRYFSCGINAAGTQVADTHRLEIAIQTTIQPDGEGSRLATQLRATANPMGSGSTAVQCSSTGALEAAIATRVQYWVLVDAGS
jgi:hypothetical protein